MNEEKQKERKVLKNYIKKSLTKLRAEVLRFEDVEKVKVK